RTEPEERRTRPREAARARRARLLHRRGEARSRALRRRREHRRLELALRLPADAARQGRARSSGGGRSLLGALPQEAQMIPAHPSATTVLIRPGFGEIEVLLLERSAGIEFHGGDWVFPGGRVDDEDVRPSEDPFAEAPARRAAVRETLEETGLR